MGDGNTKHGRLRATRRVQKTNRDIRIYNVAWVEAGREEERRTNIRIKIMCKLLYGGDRGGKKKRVRRTTSGW